MNKRWFYQILAPIGLVLMVAGCSDEEKQVVQQSETEQTGGTNQTSENNTAKEPQSRNWNNLRRNMMQSLGSMPLIQERKKPWNFMRTNDLRLHLLIRLWL